LTDIARRVFVSGTGAVWGAAAAERSFVELARTAVESAVGDSRVSSFDRTGIIMGSGLGGTRSFESGRVGPYFISNFHPGEAASAIARQYDVHGPAFATAAACASAAYAIATGYQLIKGGVIDRAIVGGADELSPKTEEGFRRTGAVTKCGVCRPFDLRRDGFLPSAGAGVLILEAEEVRPRQVVAEITGVGMTCDAYHRVMPEPRSEYITECMVQALEMAGRPEIDLVVAHATGTSKGDLAEYRGMQRVFRDLPFIVAEKHRVGHTLGACAAVEIHGVLAFQKRGETPGIETCNSPEFVLNYSETTIKRTFSRFLVNSFGFGGTNVSLTFERP